MTRIHPHLRLGLTAVAAAALLAACSSSASPSVAPSVEPSVAAPSASAEASAPASESAAPSESPAASSGPIAITIMVYALDGSFQNPPAGPTTGAVLTFRNLGTQAHELRLLRRNDDATAKQTFDDLSKVKPADLLKYATVVGVLSAYPGQEATGSITLDKPGDYAIVDFLPKGTATAPASPDPAMAPGADTNYASGMFATFSVTAAS